MAVVTSAGEITCSVRDVVQEILSVLEMDRENMFQIMTVCSFFPKFLPCHGNKFEYRVR